MRGVTTRRRRTVSKDNGASWLSFSDMMSVLVLIFVFIIFNSMQSLAKQEETLVEREAQYAMALTRLNESETALAAKEQELSVKESELRAKTSELDAQRVENERQAVRLAEQERANADQTILLAQQREDNERQAALLTEQESENARQALLLKIMQENLTVQQDQLDAIQIQVDQKQAEVQAKQTELDDMLILLGKKETDLEAAQLLLASQQSALAEQRKTLAAQTDQLAVQAQTVSSLQAAIADQQQQLEALVGVRAEIVRALSDSLMRSNIEATVDHQTGAITLKSEMLYKSGSSELSDAGRRYIDQFLPVYLNVLLSDDFSPYIAEIIVEGHTDSTAGTTGDPYLFNLRLSQERARSVADYVLSQNYMRNTLRLTADKAERMRSLVTVSGRSYSARIMNPDGTENYDASRRVEFKFRLTDDQTINELNRLIRAIEANG